MQSRTFDIANPHIFDDVMRTMPIVWQTIYIIWLIHKCTCGKLLPCALHEKCSRLDIVWMHQLRMCVFFIRIDHCFSILLYISYTFANKPKFVILKKKNDTFFSKLCSHFHFDFYQSDTEKISKFEWEGVCEIRLCVLCWSHWNHSARVAAVSTAPYLCVCVCNPLLIAFVFAHLS